MVYEGFPICRFLKSSINPPNILSSEIKCSEVGPEYVVYAKSDTINTKNLFVNTFSIDAFEQLSKINTNFITLCKTYFTSTEFNSSCAPDLLVFLDKTSEIKCNTKTTSIAINSPSILTVDVNDSEKLNSLYIKNIKN